MQRDIDINEISDGNRYRNSDMVKLGCNECDGCSSCCYDMGDSIILDPYDIYELTTNMGKRFEELLTDTLDLNIANRIILPNIRMQAVTNACIFLNTAGRCTIHAHRPGFCRLFPLGRIYEDGGFTYFNQIHECPYPNRTKVKIKKWLDIPALSIYEKYILNWHDFLKDITQKMDDAPDIDTEKQLSMLVLTTFYINPYDKEVSFYDQYYMRRKIIDSSISNLIQ